MNHNMNQNMNQNMNHSMNHNIVMFFIMIISGLLSTMNIWINKLSDFRLHLNDIYMVLLMTGWMFFFMGLFYMQINQIVFGGIMVIIFIICIRLQIFINENQYIAGMIPHHSMAVLMSKKLLEKDLQLKPDIKNLATSIIESQEREIKLMKQNE